MTGDILAAGAQARYPRARTDVMGWLGELAREQECAFILVCGDVFESNHLAPRVIKRALEAMRAVDVPIYLLPGNHDPLDAGSVYVNPIFRDALPDNVHVLGDSEPLAVGAGIRS